MGFGIFGKLPQKRDFIALNLPRAVLEPFETWLQSAVAASRNELGSAWQEHLPRVADLAFLDRRRHPWRRLRRRADAVGRQRRPLFPAGHPLSAPNRARRSCRRLSIRCDVWYFTIEERLLSVLDPKAEIEVERLTDGLSRARKRHAGRLPRCRARSRRGSVWRSDGGAASEVLSVLMTADYWDSMSGAQLLVDEWRQRLRSD